MFDAMDFLMKDLIMQARLLKTAQTMQAPSLGVTGANAVEVLGGTGTRTPSSFENFAQTVGMPAAFIPRVGGVLGNAAWAAAAPGQFLQGFDTIKQMLPSAGAFRRDITLPSSF